MKSNKEIAFFARDLGMTWQMGHLKVLFIDPLGRHTVMVGGDHYFHTCRPSVCPSVRPSQTFAQNKTKQLSSENSDRI